MLNSIVVQNSNAAEKYIYIHCGFDAWFTVRSSFVLCGFEQLVVKECDWKFNWFYIDTLRFILIDNSTNTAEIAFWLSKGTHASGYTRILWIFSFCVDKLIFKPCRGGVNAYQYCLFKNTILHWIWISGSNMDYMPLCACVQELYLPFVWCKRFFKLNFTFKLKILLNLKVTSKRVFTINKVEGMIDKNVIMYNARWIEILFSKITKAFEVN